jgi:hypothetical protein
MRASAKIRKKIKLTNYKIGFITKRSNYWTTIICRFLTMWPTNKRQLPSLAYLVTA